MTYEAVLFDVDGTLLDTREYVMASFEYAFVALGFAPPTREVLTPEIGRPLEDIYADYCGREFADQLTEVHRSFQVENLHLSQPYEEVADVLERLAVSGLRMAAVTSRSRRTSQLTLDRAGIGRYFGVVISAEDVTALKPDPEPLRSALSWLGVEAGPKVAVVGDTAGDVRAGKAIGAFTVGATYGFHGERVLEAAPDASIGAIGELPGVLGAG